MNSEEFADYREKIDKMSHLEMARLYRFAPVAHPFFNMQTPEIVEYFMKRFNSLGGMTPAISKAIGWD